jgi:outer membrane receptor for ferric coprogen and ferric-rhodotorulic acid
METRREAQSPVEHFVGGAIVQKIANVERARLGRRGPFSRECLMGASALGLALAAFASAHAETAAPAPSTAEISEVVVNGVPYRETVLPTRLSASSVYGLDIDVMDTPRSTTLLSTTQLETLNLNDPRAFSYLTSSSYTDSAFGTPNIPRVRTQYADVFYNGMRDSLTQNGYGVPINFDAFANISITKGPASVNDGPGPGVGGEVDFLTKRPNLNRPTMTMAATFDTVNNRRWMVDVSAPIIKGDLAILLSYSGEDSGSYFYGHSSGSPAPSTPWTSTAN